MRIQTTRDSASNFISGIHFAAHPKPPEGGKLLVSEDVEPDADGVAGLLSLDGFSPAPDYPPVVLAAVDEAITRAKNSVSLDAAAEANQTVTELQAANQNLARTIAEKTAQIAALEKQIGETAVGELRDEIGRLQTRLKEAEDKAANAGTGREPSDVEKENARLRTTNESLGTEATTLRGQVDTLTSERDTARAELATVTAERDKLIADLGAATALLDESGGGKKGSGGKK